jgi:hypothetical protein
MILLEIWEGLGKVSPPQATVIGTVFGAVLGFTTLTLGALFNAFLTRRRDRALHRFQQANLLQAMLTEVEQVQALLNYQIGLLRNTPEEQELFSVINPATLVVIYSSNLSSLHLLPAQAIQQLVAIHSAIAEHEYNIEAYGGKLVSKPAFSLKSFNFEKKTKQVVVKLNRDLAEKCGSVLERCRPILRSLE